MNKKLRHIMPLAVAASGLAIAFAPTASAAPTNTSGNPSIVTTPGNAQITTRPGPSATQAGAQQYPFAGDTLLFHNAHGAVGGHPGGHPGGHAGGGGGGSH
ncbi:hypothetical protein [Mycolicibacterium sp.]|uniref:hypothetical protein n=1 Tax=Mycolicibacterium sp. TaxID=2320850 RepID=UPI001DDC8535|nr:hypothetical protein [Mycolicibacterium sp.]MCB1290638.1 hypothetical protein [Mycobacterium sp.]MCB9408998.1 hypothetical protein [Mycolicibacterium sp.]